MSNSDFVDDFSKSDTYAVEDAANVPKFYTINKERFINPSYLHKKVCSRVLDNWPAHSSGRLHPTTQIMVNNVHRIKVQSEHESKLPNLVPKPKFLEFLENHVKKELIRHKVTDVKPNTLRLQIYGEAFEWLLQALKSYRPLLASIKREYELNIEHLRSELRKVEPMKELLWTLSQEYDQRLMAIRNKESQQIKQLKGDKSAVIQELSDLKADKDTMMIKLKRLVEELEAQSTLCRTEADARKILIADMNDLRSKLKEMERLAKLPEDGEEREDVVKLRWAYDEAKVTIMNANKKIVYLEASYSNVVPKSHYDEVITRNLELMETNQELADAKFIITNSFQSLQTQYNAIYIQRDHLYMQLKNTRQKLMSANPMSKVERAAMEKNDQRLQQVRENLEEEANKWIMLANELSHDELVRRIEEELAKTDGSAEIAMEVLMNPQLQEVLANQNVVAAAARGGGAGQFQYGLSSETMSNDN